MKKLYLFLFVLASAAVSAQQNQYGVLYSILNTQCQNASCHSATSQEALKFDGDSDAVYNAIFNVAPSNATSLANHEMLVNPQMPYASFLLRKIAGAQFDAYLTIGSTEGALMKDINGNQLSNTQIEYFRQWIMFGALKSYTSGSTPIAQPDFATVAQYYSDTIQTPFLQAPPAPDSGVGVQLRMGPIFIPTTGAVEQELVEQNVVYFPYAPEVAEIDGIMTEQSHHFLLFQYPDSVDARDPANNAPDVNDIGQVTPPLTYAYNGLITGTEPFAGVKNLVGIWQNNSNFVLPYGTALMWNQKTYLDMDFHVKNYGATSVLPCDFYFNIYYKPQNPKTIPMVSTLINNLFFGSDTCSQWPLKVLPVNQTYVDTFDDAENTTVNELRYVWMLAGHTHQWGTDFQIMQRDANTGELENVVYNGDSDYSAQQNIGYWDWHHPPIEFISPLLPVQFGGAKGGGLTAKTTWYSDSSCIHFGFTTNEEMDLFYYMYTTSPPPSQPTNINSATEAPFYFMVTPNPMGGGSNGKLVYTLDKSSTVEASIIDITGKTIANLGSENEVSGLHEISLGKNQGLAAGIYLAKLVVNGDLYTRKFVVTE